MTFNQFYSISNLFRAIEQLEADYNKAMSEVILSGAKTNVTKEQNDWFRKITRLKLQVISEHSGMSTDDLYKQKTTKVKEMFEAANAAISEIKPVLAQELKFGEFNYTFAPGSIKKALDDTGVREYVEEVNAAELVESLEITRLLEDKELSIDGKYTLHILAICLAYRPTNYEEKTFDVENYLRLNYMHFDTISAENGLAAFNFFFHS